MALIRPLNQLAYVFLLVMCMQESSYSAELSCKSLFDQNIKTTPHVNVLKIADRIQYINNSVKEIYRLNTEFESYLNLVEQKKTKYSKKEIERRLQDIQSITTETLDLLGITYVLRENFMFDLKLGTNDLLFLKYNQIIINESFGSDLPLTALFQHILKRKNLELVFDSALKLGEYKNAMALLLEKDDIQQIIFGPAAMIAEHTQILHPIQHELKHFDESAKIDAGLNTLARWTTEKFSPPPTHAKEENSGYQSFFRFDEIETHFLNLKLLQSTEIAHVDLVPNGNEKRLKFKSNIVARLNFFIDQGNMLLRSAATENNYMVHAIDESKINVIFRPGTNISYDQLRLILPRDSKDLQSKIEEAIHNAKSRIKEIQKEMQKLTH